MVLMEWGLLVASFARSASKLTPAQLQNAAIERQRAAARKQATSLGLWMQPGSPVPAPIAAAASAPEQPACDPIAASAVTPLIENAARAQNLDTKVIRAVMEQESALRPCAISARGAEGLMQLMPETAGQLGVRDAFDPKESVEAGAKYLRQLLDKYKGDMARALGAYNAGPAAVDQAGGVPPIPETKDYVDAIMKKLGLTQTAPPNSQTPKPTGN